MTRTRAHRRARPRAPLIIGLTGSIAMGKTTAAKVFRELGVPVFDSDATSRALSGPNGAALPAIANAFPGLVINGTLDRKALANLVFSSSQKLRQLEQILHPLIKRARAKFLSAANRQRRKVVVFDIPLLFETNATDQCDAVIVVSAPAFLQRQRVLARPGMTAELFKSVLARQMPDYLKRVRADVTIPSGLGRAFARQRIKKSISTLISS